MNQPKPKQAFVIVGLYGVSFILLVLSLLVRSAPVLVFELTYQPLNVTTTADVDEGDFLIFSELNQVIELPTLDQGRYRLDVSTSGGIVVDSVTETGQSALTLLAENQEFPIEIDELIGSQQVTWRQSTLSSVTLTMTNFVKINHSLLYAVYVQDIQIYKI
jgi:hypothetical protein